MMPNVRIGNRNEFWIRTHQHEMEDNTGWKSIGEDVTRLPTHGFPPSQGFSNKHKHERQAPVSSTFGLTLKRTHRPTCATSIDPSITKRCAQTMLHDARYHQQHIRVPPHLETLTAALQVPKPASILTHLKWFLSLPHTMYTPYLVHHLLGPALPLPAANTLAPAGQGVAVV